MGRSTPRGRQVPNRFGDAPAKKGNRFGDANGTKAKPEVLVYAAFRKAGFSHKGAKVLTAEVGRENDFQEKYLYGGHSDPANKASNLGLISWQGDRREALLKHLKEQGALGEDGRIVPTPKSLVAQATFLRTEMATGKHGGGQPLVDMLSREDISYRQAAQDVGKGFIKWRYDDPEFKSHHDRRDNYYKRVSELTDPTEGAGT